MKEILVVRGRADCQIVWNVINSHFAGHDSPLEVTIAPYVKRRNISQLKTLWMWHGEAVGIVNMRNKQVGCNALWTKENWHDYFFKPRFMPKRVFVVSGETILTDIGASDKECSVTVLSDAMDKYLAWLYDNDIDVTVPDDSHGRL